MSDGEPTADFAGAEPDRQLFELLDQYVRLLHSEATAARADLLARHPELADLLACLDELESLAPPSTSNVVSPQRGNDDPTISPGNHDQHFNPAICPNPAAAATGEINRPGLFGRYELLEEIGRGGMGVVYRARQSDLDRTVAVKMILSSRFASADEIRRFYAEARAAGSLQHPNIVGIHEVGEIDGQHYFAMDLVDGPSLAEVIRQGNRSPDAAAETMAVVARAVAYLHEQGIIHRDLKPSNILFDQQRRPYVTDFGLARIFSTDGRHTQTGTIVGTPNYMSPEQATGRTGDISPQSDVYSLGAVLYEMLIGRPPFQQETPLDTLVDVIEGEPTLPHVLNRHIPRELELICLRCLEKDPRKRYRSAAALADDLEHFLKREPVSARPSGIIQRLRRWGRREPALVSRLIGLLCAASIVQGDYLWEGKDPVVYSRVMAVFGLWAIACVVFQRLLHREWWANFARFSWAAADVVLLTIVLLLAHGPIGPLLIGYPLLIAAAGLFFRVRLVTFTTVVSMASFVWLMVQRGEVLEQPQYAVIFVTVLAVIGFVVAYQVYRVRVLSRYYDHRRLP